MIDRDSADLSYQHLDKAARCGEPSYVWRAGQSRRLEMILEATQPLLNDRILENGCGVGMYVEKLAAQCGYVFGLEYDFERASQARQLTHNQPNVSIVNAAGENLPFPDNSLAMILSHEVLEHVQDDRQAVREMVRALKPGGRLVIFAPNRGYPFETHGIYWGKRYIFGNIPLVNYLPLRLRHRLAPHVRIYTSGGLRRLFQGLPVNIVVRRVIFGAYDNIIARHPMLGKFLRHLLQALEKTPLQIFGLSHFWVVEKCEATGEP